MDVAQGNPRNWVQRDTGKIKATDENKRRKIEIGSVEQLAELA